MMTLSRERHIVLELARYTADRLVTAEACYFRRVCVSGRSHTRRDFRRAMWARDVARDFADALADDVMELQRLGLASVGREILEDAGLRIAQARANHCVARGLDPLLVNLVSPACDEPAHKREGY